MFTVAMLGSGGSGKSSLAIRFVNDHFVTRYDPTIEDAYRKQIEVDGRSLTLTVYDTAGQSEYNDLVDNVLRSCEVAIICVPSDRPDALREAERDISRAIRAIHSLNTDAPSMPVVIARTKTDVSPWLVNATDIEHLIELARAETKHRMGIEPADVNSFCRYIETSALSKKGVIECFEIAARLAIAQHSAIYSPNTIRTRTRSTGSLVEMIRRHSANNSVVPSCDSVISLDSHAGSSSPGAHSDIHSANSCSTPKQRHNGCTLL